MWISENKVISGFLVISIIFVAFSVWEGSYKASDVILRLCLAYIASFIFYMVAVIGPRKKDQDKVRKAIEARIHGIIESADFIFYELCGGKKPDFDRRTINFHDLQELCKRVDPMKLSPAAFGWDGKRATAAEVLLSMKNKSIADIQQMLVFAVYLDMKLIKLLIKLVESHNFLNEYVLTHSKEFKGTGLEFLSDNFFLYFQTIRELEDYRNVHFDSSAEKHKEKYLFPG